MFRPLKIPKDLQRNLPFKDKPKIPKKMVDNVQAGRVAVIRDVKEKKVSKTSIKAGKTMGKYPTLGYEGIRSKVHSFSSCHRNSL